VHDSKLVLADEGSQTPGRMVNKPFLPFSRTPVLRDREPAGTLVSVDADRRISRVRIFGLCCS
jgi:hypothetical protein